MLSSPPPPPPPLHACTSICADVCTTGTVLKLLKMMSGIRSLLDTVMRALPQVGNLGLLFFLLFYIFAALGVEMFGRLGELANWHFKMDDWKPSYQKLNKNMIFKLLFLFIWKLNCLKKKKEISFWYRVNSVWFFKFFFTKNMIFLFTMFYWLTSLYLCLVFSCAVIVLLNMHACVVLSIFLLFFVLITSMARPWERKPN